MAGALVGETIGAVMGGGTRGAGVEEMGRCSKFWRYS
jgi:hypothetical protein